MVILIVIMVWFANGQFATTVVKSTAPTLEICQKNIATTEAGLLNTKPAGVDDVQVSCVAATKRPVV